MEPAIQISWYMFEVGRSVETLSRCPAVMHSFSFKATTKLLCAVVVCYGGEGGDDQLWGSGRGAL